MNLNNYKCIYNNLILQQCDLNIEENDISKELKMRLIEYGKFDDTIQSLSSNYPLLDKILSFKFFIFM